MEIQIGIQNCSRELSFEVDMTPEEITEKVEGAVSSEKLLTFVDTKGRHFTVVPSTLAYVSTGASEVRSVGFGRA